MIAQLSVLAALALVFVAVAVCIPLLVGLAGDTRGGDGRGAGVSGPGVRVAGFERTAGLDPADAAERVTCRFCGAPNKPGFRHCRRCVERL